MVVQTGFDAGHEGFEVVSEVDYAGSGCSDCFVAFHRLAVRP